MTEPQVPQVSSLGSRAPAPDVDATAADPARWVTDHLDAVLRYARLRIGPEDAEDVTQQAFQALFRAHTEGRTPEHPGGWLLSVVRRRIVDLHRRRGRAAHPVALPVGWEGFCERALPDELLARREMRELVAVAMGSLPAQQRELLEAVYRRGDGPTALAARRGTTPKAMEMRLRRARERFRAAFLALGQDLSASPDGGGAA